MWRWGTKHRLLNLLPPASAGTVSLNGRAGKPMLPGQPVSTAHTDPGEMGPFTEPARVFCVQSDAGFLVPKRLGSPLRSCSLY